MKDVVPTHFICVEVVTSHTLVGRLIVPTMLRGNSKHRRNDFVHLVHPKLRLFAKRLFHIGHVLSGNVGFAATHRHFSVMVVFTFVPAAMIEMGNAFVADLDRKQWMEYLAVEKAAHFPKLAGQIDISMDHLSIVNKFITALLVRHQQHLVGPFMSFLVQSISSSILVEKMV